MLRSLGAQSKQLRPDSPGWAHDGHDERRRIVVGVDGSEVSKGALRWAARQARLTGASLDVVMTWELPTLPHGVWGGYDESQDAQQALNETVRDVLGKTKEGEVLTRAIEGPPAPRLLEAAKGADLLVVGSEGHGPVAGLLLGSVSQQCVAHAPCPVVVVPPS